MSMISPASAVNEPTAQTTSPITPAASISEPLLRASFSAGFGKHRILSDVAFQIAPGESFGLVGSSGAGKSTVILALMGMLGWKSGWAEGEIFFEGQNLLHLPDKPLRHIRGGRIALVPQSPTAALNGSLRLRTHFEEAWRAHEPHSTGLATRIETLLEQVGLPATPDFLSRKPGQISVGQAQRLVLALALLHRPTLLVADEPTSALDPANRQNVVNLLTELRQQENTALLYISHDLFSVLQLCRRMAVLHAGSLVETLPTDRIEQAARHLATLDLLRSLPVPASILQTHWQQSTAHHR